MDYPTLKIVHLVGLVLVFMGLAGVLASKASTDVPFKKRWLFHLSHGVGLLLIICSGFALAYQLGVREVVPGWLKGKMVIWLLAGGSMVLATRFSRFAGSLLIFFALLVLAAAWLAIEKPF
jgi:hypothetical protein